MKKLTALFSLLALATPAFAADAVQIAPAPAAESAAKPRRTQQQLAADKAVLAGKLVGTLKINDQLKGELANMHGTIDAGFAKMLEGPAAGQDAIVARHRAAIHKAINDAFDAEAIRKEIIAVYASAFTEQELKDINAFYDSPSGKAFTAKSMELLKSVGGTVEKRKESLNPKIMGMLQQMGMEVQAAQDAAGKAAPVTAPAAK